MTIYYIAGFFPDSEYQLHYNGIYSNWEAAYMASKDGEFPESGSVWIIDTADVLDHYISEDTEIDEDED